MLRQNSPSRKHRKSFLVRIRSFVVLAAAAASGLAFAAEPLTTAQVEKVTGLSGLSIKPAKYDKVAKNYVTSKNDLAVSVKVASAAIYDVWKSQPSMDDQTSLPGLGEEAITSKKGRYICFKKAGTGLCVVGMVALPGTPALVSDAQLLELARLAASNL
jgi:hypothetical protein